jgi:integrase
MSSHRSSAAAAATCRRVPSDAAAAEPRSAFRVKVVICASGERLPVLIRHSDGLPAFLPNVFALSQVRGRSRAANTIERCLRSVGFLLEFAAREHIDLFNRVETGVLFAPHEIDRLADAASRRADYLRGPRAIGRRLKEATVAPHTAAVRLQYAREFIAWLSARRLARLQRKSTEYPRYHASRQTFLERLSARVPTVRRFSTVPRIGLSHDEEAAVLAITDPQNPSNPWTGVATRVRNDLLIRWLLALGVRGGELLSARLDDIDFRLNQIRLVRRHDSAEDPRRRQPVLKTHERDLPIDGLAQRTQEYVLHFRSRVKKARRHPYLFVELRSGAPLSISGLTKVFRQLRTCSGIPPRFTPHLARHTWNDRFSEAMDRDGIRGEQEERMRSYLQGWNPGTRTAAIYTKRHVRERARAAAVEIQRAIVNGRPRAR